MGLRNIGWGFGRCNMNCRHCYGASTFETPEHSFAELKAIADRICPEIASINYGTGEFIFNPNAVELARYIASSYPQVAQAVTTNGSTPLFMNPTDVKRLFHDIDISIDYPDPEEHIKFRRHPKAWDWVERSLRLCTDLEMEKSIVTCVTAKTSDDDIKRFLEMAAKNNASWRVNWFRKTGRGKSNLMISRLRFWQIIALIAEEGAVFESLSDPLIASVLGRPDKNPVGQGCSCGLLSCRIQPDLTVTPCVYLKGRPWSAGSIAEMTLNEIYNSRAFRLFRGRAIPKFCLQERVSWDSGSKSDFSPCALRFECQGGCASRAFLHHGDMEHPDDCCPYRGKNGESLFFTEDIVGLIRSITEKIKVVEQTGKVHDGYLCTLIVKP